jgi:hypothetical protein
LGGGSRPGSSGKDSLFTGQTEEYGICEDQTRAIICPQDFRSVLNSGQGPDSYPAQDSGSGGDSG